MQEGRGVQQLLDCRSPMRLFEVSVSHLRAVAPKGTSCHWIAAICQPQSHTSEAQILPGHSVRASRSSVNTVLPSQAVSSLVEL